MNIKIDQWNHGCKIINGKEPYWLNNERSLVVAEWFIRTLKDKIYKYLTNVLKKIVFR